MPTYTQKEKRKKNVNFFFKNIELSVISINNLTETNLKNI